MSRRPAKPSAPLVPNDALARIAARAGVPVAEVAEAWTERAAVREYCGNMDRDIAELAAVDDVSSIYAKEER